MVPLPLVFATRRRFPATGFSLVELLLVMFVVTLLCAIAVPTFSKFVKTSKVDQASKIVISAMYHARSEAQRFRTAVGVFYGDTCTTFSPAPLPGVVPPDSTIELWTVRTVSYSGYGTECEPYAPEQPASDPYPVWYPYRFKDRKLDQTYTLPSGIRVMAGAYTPSGNKGFFNFACYRKDPKGEIKRHHTVYDGRGSMPSYLNYAYAWFHVVVFDEASGDHVIIEAGQWQSSTRPRILPGRITDIGVSGNSVHLAKPADLAHALDAFPGNS